MQNAASIARSWTSGVRPDVRGMSEKYLSRNIDGKVGNSMNSPRDRCTNRSMDSKDSSNRSPHSNTEGTWFQTDGILGEEI